MSLLQTLVLAMTQLKSSCSLIVVVVWGRSLLTWIHQLMLTWRMTSTWSKSNRECSVQLVCVCVCVCVRTCVCVHEHVCVCMCSIQGMLLELCIPPPPLLNTIPVLYRGFSQSLKWECMVLCYFKGFKPHSVPHQRIFTERLKAPLAKGPGTLYSLTIHLPDPITHHAQPY